MLDRRLQRVDLKELLLKLEHRKCNFDPSRVEPNCSCVQAVRICFTKRIELCLKYRPGVAMSLDPARLVSYEAQI
jgi:hypothetical protein